MEPRIQYAKTSDGVNIACYALGEGPPLVIMFGTPTHVELEWRMPLTRGFFEETTKRWTLVRYDSRGVGLSDQGVTDFSVTAMVRDLEAVADRLGLDKFRLQALDWRAPVAIAYAAAHPDRVSHLCLWHGVVRGADWWSERLDALLALIRKDWEMGIDSLIHAHYGWATSGFGREWAEIVREAVSRETFISFMEQMRDWDVSDLLPSLAVPTLVMHRRHFPFVTVDAARNLAAAIPEARLVLLEGSSNVMGPNAQRAAMAFFHEGTPPESSGSEPTSGMTAILFADIADSTALTERLGDAAFREKARELDGALRAVIREHGGTPIEGKLLGDGVLAVFTSARQAIEAALACASAGDDAGFPLHLGLHAGDVIREEGNVYGGAVNVAARISGLSAAGEVLVSETVRSLARTSAGVRFEDRGEQSLKGVGEAVRLWAVMQGEAS